MQQSKEWHMLYIQEVHGFSLYVCHDFPSMSVPLISYIYHAISL